MAQILALAPRLEADAVVSSLGLEEPRSREVVEALRARAPDTPLVVDPPTAEPELVVEAVRAACPS